MLSAPAFPFVETWSHTEVQVLSALVAGVSSLAAGKAVADVTSVDLFDDRGAKKKGFDIIYEARDLDLPQNERDGISQYRGDLTATKARYSEAERRINTKLGDYVKTQYWYASGSLWPSALTPCGCASLSRTLIAFRTGCTMFMNVLSCAGLMPRRSSASRWATSARTCEPLLPQRAPSLSARPLSLLQRM